MVNGSSVRQIVTRGSWLALVSTAFNKRILVKPLIHDEAFYNSGQLVPSSLIPLSTGLTAVTTNQ